MLRAVINTIWNCGNLLKKKDITADLDMSIFPPCVRELTGNSDTQYPANCWNATQLYFGHAKRVGHTTSSDMELWLAANTIPDEHKLCRPGTIMVLRKGAELWHTGVFVAPNLLWHKFGCSGKWEFVTLKQMVEERYPFCNHEYRLLKE